MTRLVDIRPDHLEIVQNILREYLRAGIKVWVFGSRANWTTKDSSDLDLALESESRLSHKLLGSLKDAFEDSALPYTVDVVDLSRIGSTFRQIVESQRTPLPMDGDGTRQRVSLAAHLTGGTASGGATLTVTSSQWHEVALGEFAPFAYGKSLPARKRNPSGAVPVVGSNGIVGYHDSALTQGPTLVVGRKGTVGAVHYLHGPCWPIDTTFYVTGNDAELVRFKYYALMALGLDQMNSDSAVPGLNRDAAHARVLLVPDTSEQRAISRILSALDDKIELNQRMNETLEEMARALFKSWFVDFDPVRAKMQGLWRRGESLPGLPADIYDFFSDRLVPSELGEIPEGWEVKALGELVELAYGKALRAADRKEGAIPVYGSNGQVGWHDERLVAGPGIVVGRKGNPGVVTWVHGDFFPIDTTFYVAPRGANGESPFLFFALTGQGLPSVSADSAVPGLNRNMAYMNRQLVPGKYLVAKFDDYASAIFSRCHHRKEESRTLAAQRDALLPGLVSGDVGVGDAERAMEVTN